MLWTQAVLAVLAIIGLVLAAEDVKEKIDSTHPDQMVMSASNQESEKKVAHERGDTLPHYKPPQKGVGGQESAPIPVPLPLPINHGHVIIPGPKRVQTNPPQNHQRNKESSSHGYQASHQIQGSASHPDFQASPLQGHDFHGSHQAQVHQSFEVAHPGHIDFQGGRINYQGGGGDHHDFQDGHQQQYQAGAPQVHHEYDGGHNGIVYQDDGHQNLQPQPVYHGNDEYGGYRPENHNNQFQGFPSLPNSEPWPLPMPDMPKIVHLDVKCEKNLMKVAVEFDKPFHGIVFSKGHYSYGSCVHLPAGSGHTSVYFDISINSCGTYGNTQNGQYGYGAHGGGGSNSGTFFENTIVVQYDSQVQEVWDQARKLRCTWHDQYEKAVTFRPFPVDMLNVVRADFAGDNVGCWMQIQVGKGPWASEVAGIVKIGQTMTMVLAIKDEENKFDMMVRNCIAHDGKRAPIELVDSQGCIVRPKLMSRFTKVKNFGSSASVLAFAHFQAFKFPDSMDVHFQCTIQICRPHCPEQCGGSPISSHLGHDSYSSAGYGSAGRPREERDVSQKIWKESLADSTVREMTEIGLNRVIRVVSTGDLAFTDTAEKSVPVYQIHEKDDLICMSTPGFAASLVVLLSILVISCLIAAFLCLRQKTPRDIITTISSTVIKKNKP